MKINAQGQKILVGDGTWPFTATVDGNDITVGDENITTGVSNAIIVATNFGGPDDRQDNGETASGISTIAHPNVLGCALPMNGEHCTSTNGSPLPKMPYETTFVHVCNEDNGVALTFPVIDLGPSEKATSRPDQVHGIDLTQAAFIALGGDPDDGIMHVRYRVIGGATRLPQS